MAVLVPAAQHRVQLVLVPRELLHRGLALVGLVEGPAQVHTPYGATEAVPFISIGSDEILAENFVALVLGSDDLPTPRIPAELAERLRALAARRAARQAEFPADFQLVAAMNPCPCGYANDPARICSSCSPATAARYQRRVSGPLRDRIDIQIEVPALPRQELLMGLAEASEDSATVRRRVIAAWRIQLERQGAANARLSQAGLARHCTLPDKGAALLTGFEAAAAFADWAITIDADGQHRPEEAEQLVAAALQRAPDLGLRRAAPIAARGLDVIAALGQVGVDHLLDDLGDVAVHHSPFARRGR